ncbi:MAG TPA: hypothetical protein VK468_07205 [Pyrinomonadaceae bacterium]|nr:hypothetical protein [Pyrinomonadaceae bacterium]
MNEPEEKEVQGKPGLKDRISGTAQFIIGEIETIGGVLTGDPNTQAEGEFNVEVGTVRDEIHDDLEESGGDPSK